MQYLAIADCLASTAHASPRDAAMEFFARFPGKRKCVVMEGEAPRTGGAYFLTQPGGRRWRVRRDAVDALPE